MAPLRRHWFVVATDFEPLNDLAPYVIIPMLPNHHYGYSSGHYFSHFSEAVIANDETFRFIRCKVFCNRETCSVLSNNCSLVELNSLGCDLKWVKLSKFRSDQIGN